MLQNEYNKNWGYHIILDNIVTSVAHTHKLGTTADVGVRFKINEEYE